MVFSQDVNSPADLPSNDEVMASTRMSPARSSTSCSETFSRTRRWMLSMRPKTRIASAGRAERCPAARARRM